MLMPGWDGKPWRKQPELGSAAAQEEHLAGPVPAGQEPLSPQSPSERGQRNQRLLFGCFLVFFEQRCPNTPHFFPKQLLMEAPIQLLSACSPCRMEFARTGITQEKEGLQVTESAGRAARMRRALPQPAALCRHRHTVSTQP